MNDLEAGQSRAAAGTSDSETQGCLAPVPSAGSSETSHPCCWTPDLPLAHSFLGKFLGCSRLPWPCHLAVCIPSGSRADTLSHVGAQHWTGSRVPPSPGDPSVNLSLVLAKGSEVAKFRICRDFKVRPSQGLAKAKVRTVFLLPPWNVPEDSFHLPSAARPRLQRGKHCNWVCSHDADGETKAPKGEVSWPRV